MIRSMTGYGKVSDQYPEHRITAEIRTLNSKQSDISVRLPSAYREKELEIRKILNEKLVRGKIDCNLTVEDFTGENLPVVNEQAIREYLQQLRKITSEMDLRSEDSLLQGILRWPEVLSDRDHKVSDEEWTHILETIRKTVEAVDGYRRDEGSAIATDLKTQIELIIQLLGMIPPYEKERITIIRERLTKSLEEAGKVSGNEKERLEQEIFFYLEKLDISEEKSRLKHHCSYFLDTIASNGAVGKKLGFITQEMGREINTLGSKAYHAEIQKIVIRMKDTLEKIKEQVLNVL